MGLKQTYQNAGRLKEIAQVFLELELHHLIDVFSFQKHLPWHKRIHKKETLSHTQPETVRLIFERLGGAFLKLGQLLALRPDLIGKEYSKEFESLLDQVPEQPWEDIEPIINSRLKKGIKTFKSFNKKPIASGSIAQVYKAKLHNGKEVAVKVRRPGIEKQFNEDINIMFALTEILSKKYDLEFLDPEAIVTEFKKYTLKELDLNHELRNIVRFKKNFQEHKNIHIPKPYEHYCSEDILVMEFINGTQLLEKRPRQTNKKIVQTLHKAVNKQLFEDGFFHADLHPGNILIEKTSKGPRIAFIDFGIVGYINKNLKKKMRNLFLALIEGSLEKTSHALIELSTNRSDPDPHKIEEGIYHAIGDYYGMPINKMPIPKMLSDLIDVARKTNLTLPSQIVLFSKSLLTLDGSARELDPTFNVVETAKPYIKKLLKEDFTPRNLAKGATSFALETKDLISNTPQMIKSFARKIQMLENSVEHIDKTTHYLSHVIWKVSKLGVYSILFSSFLVSSALLLRLQPQWNNFSAYSWVSTTIALVLLGLIILTLRDTTEHVYKR